MTETLLSWLTVYGVAGLFVILTVGSIGLPLPCSTFLIVVGSFVEQGDMDLLTVVILASAGAVLGDQIGYWIGRSAGHAFVTRVTNRIGGAKNIERAHAFNARWGSTGIFLTRWLIGPLGPWVNLSCGMTRFGWIRFLLWCVAGEVLWVVLYVMLGKLFSDRVLYLADLMGDLTWFIVGVVAAIFLGWKLLHYFRHGVSDSNEPKVATT